MESQRPFPENETGVSVEPGKKRSRKTLFISLLAGVVIVAVLAIALATAIIPANKYRAAADLFSEGRYEEAAAAFASLGGFKDSAEQIRKCQEGIFDRQYNAALSLFDGGDYNEAITAFSALGDYKDSADQIQKCKDYKTYDSAVKCYEEGNYQDAYSLFYSVLSVKDAKKYFDSIIAKPTKVSINYDGSVEETLYYYDASGRLIRSKDYETIDYSYDEVSGLLVKKEKTESFSAAFSWMVYEDKYVTEYHYDSTQTLIKKKECAYQNENGREPVFTDYLLRNDILFKTVRGAVESNGEYTLGITEYYYDEAGRLIQKRYDEIDPESEDEGRIYGDYCLPDTTVTVNYQYNENGLCVAADVWDYGHSHYEGTRDENGKLILETVTFQYSDGSKSVYSTKYTYSKEGLLQKTERYSGEEDSGDYDRVMTTEYAFFLKNKSEHVENMNQWLIDNDTWTGPYLPG